MSEFVSPLHDAIDTYLCALQKFDGETGTYTDIELSKIYLADELLRLSGLPTSPPDLNVRHIATPQIPMGFVYLMKNLRNGLIKIGWSTNPCYREKTLQSEEPEVQLLWCKPGVRADESAYHLCFRSKRVRGEWFALTEQDIHAIQQEPVGDNQELVLKSNGGIR